MSKASIVDEYLKRPVHDESLTEGISDLANQLNKMSSIKIDQNSEKQRMSKNLLERKRHKKAELPEKLESIALKSGFNQERNMGSNQSQIHNFMNRNREPTATGKSEEKKNIYYQLPLKVYQDKKEISRMGMTRDKAHHYPESIKYEDISIALNEVDSWIDLLSAHVLLMTYKMPKTASSDIPMMWQVY